MPPRKKKPNKIIFTHTHTHSPFCEMFLSHQLNASDLKEWRRKIKHEKEKESSELTFKNIPERQVSLTDEFLSIKSKFEMQKGWGTRFTQAKTFCFNTGSLADKIWFVHIWNNFPKTQAIKGETAEDILLRNPIFFFCQKTSFAWRLYILHAKQAQHSHPCTHARCYLVGKDAKEETGWKEFEGKTQKRRELLGEIGWGVGVASLVSIPHPCSPAPRAIKCFPQEHAHLHWNCSSS